MPEMDGYALITAMRAEEPAGEHRPILALTANTLPEEALNGSRAGMDGCLSKPVRLEQLRLAIAAWLPPPVVPGETDSGTEHARRPTGALATNPHCT